MLNNSNTNKSTSYIHPNSIDLFGPPSQTKDTYWWYAATSVDFLMQKLSAQPGPNMSSLQWEKYTRTLATQNVINATMDHHSMDKNAMTDP